MRCRVLICLALIMGFASEAQEAANAEWACSGGMRDQVVMSATGETLTVATIMRPSAIVDTEGVVTGYDWPQFDQSVSYLDGQVLFRFKASKLFDDVGPLSCEERLTAAQRQLSESIAAARKLDLSDQRVMSEPVRMMQLSACLRNPDACNVAPHYVQPSEALRTVGTDGFDTLLSGMPVIFNIFLSACVNKTYVYNPETKTTLHVESGDC